MSKTLVMATQELKMLPGTKEFRLQESEDHICSFLSSSYRRVSVFGFFFFLKEHSPALSPRQSGGAVV